MDPITSGPASEFETSRTTTFDHGKEATASLTDKGRDMASTLVDKAKDAASTVATKTQEVASTVAHRTSEVASQVGHRTGEAARTVVHKVEAGSQYLREQGVGGVVDDVTQTIRRHPLPALAIGFTFGFLLANVLRRR
jgi:hypothetical protein